MLLPIETRGSGPNEIHQVHSGIIELYRQIPKTTQLWWGAIRNLLCGVTTVCHHNPLHDDLTHPDFPVRVLSRFGWSHSIAFDPDVKEKFQRTPKEQPFILHAAEGMDEESRNEVPGLTRCRCWVNAPCSSMGWHAPQRRYR